MFLFPWVITLFSQSLGTEVAAFVWDQILVFGEWHIVRVAVGLCHALLTKVKQTADWQRVIKDAGVHLTCAQDIAHSLAKVNKQVRIDYVRQLMRRTWEFPGESLDREWDFC